MAKPELKLSVPAGGTTPMPDIQRTVQTSRAAAPPSVDQVQEKRDAIHAATHAQHQADAEAADDTAPGDVAATKVREDIESIEVTLMDKRVVVFGPPPGVSLTMRISMLLGDRQTEAMHALARVCMCVRSVNGRPPWPPIGNMVDLQRAANVLGDQGLDHLGYLLTEHWPPVSLGELPSVKKNLR